MVLYMAYKQCHVHKHPNLTAHNEELYYVGSVNTIHRLYWAPPNNHISQHADMHDSYGPAFIA